MNSSSVLDWVRSFFESHPDSFQLSKLHKQIVAGKETPLIVVQRSVDCSGIPEYLFDEEGTVLLDINPKSTDRLRISDKQLQFDADFDGSLRCVSIPIESIQAMYAKETGEGLLFGELRKEAELKND